jgi:hypothetical protein
MKGTPNNKIRKINKVAGLPIAKINVSEGLPALSGNRVLLGPPEARQDHARLHRKTQVQFQKITKEQRIEATMPNYTRKKSAIIFSWYASCRVTTIGMAVLARGIHSLPRLILNACDCSHMSNGPSFWLFRSRQPLRKKTALKSLSANW